MTEEILEEILLGHIAKELKDEIQIGRQVNLAKTIMQALRIHDVVGRSEQFICCKSDLGNSRCSSQCVECGRNECYSK
jgi:hypothetical protein